MCAALAGKGRRKFGRVFGSSVRKFVAVRKLQSFSRYPKIRGVFKAFFEENSGMMLPQGLSVE